MIPFIHLGPVEIPTFGLMVAAAMVAAYYVLRADMARRGLASKDSTTAEIFIAIPCLVGIRARSFITSSKRRANFLPTRLGCFSAATDLRGSED